MAGGKLLEGDIIDIEMGAGGNIQPLCPGKEFAKRFFALQNVLGAGKTSFCYLGGKNTQCYAPAAVEILGVRSLHEGTERAHRK